MDRANMHKEFKLLLDKAGGGGAPSFISEEIDRFLNIAQDKFVSKRAFGNNVRRTSFEEDQKRRDDLRTLVRNEVISSTVDSSSNKPNGAFFQLPNYYRHSINEEALIFTIGDGNSQRRVGVTPITHDRYNKIIDDPFNKPGKDTVYRLDFGGQNYGSHVELIVGDGQQVGEYHLRYIIEPPEIKDKNDCLLPEHTHREIVRMAVVDALETVEQPRYQTSKIELNELE